MSCLETALRHVSVRRYTGEPVRREDLEAIVEAARRAPSAWGIQPVSVVAVTDEGLKARLAEMLGGQEHVAKAPLFLVFAVDYAKVLEASRLLGVEAAQPGPGHLASALIDVGIASAWAAITAEELGYGITFIAVYGAACEVAEQLSMPSLVVPVVGLTVGRPAEKPPLQPRHPRQAFLDVNRYGDPAAKARAMAGDGALWRKYSKVCPVVLPPGAYNDDVGRRLWECLRRRGFRV